VSAALLLFGQRSQPANEPTETYGVMMATIDSSPYPAEVNRQRNFRARQRQANQREGHQHKPLPVIVYVYDLDTNKRIRTLNFNYMSREDKAHINKVSLWAFHNHKAVEIVNECDAYNDAD